MRRSPAVVRPDVLLPTNGLTIAILREEALIVVAPATNGIVDFEDLAGKRLGVLGEHEADFPAIGSVLSHYALNQSDAIPIRSEEIGDAIATKRVDAIAFLAPPISDRATRLVRAVLQIAQGRVNVVPITQADALALKTPALGPTTIPPGALSGRPQTPEKEVKTIAVSYRLMARSGLDRGPISRLTEYLFQSRARIAHTTAAINFMKAPSVAKPPVYAIALNQLTDPEGYAKDYLPKGRAAILAHGGVYVAAGKGNVITGDVKADRVVVLRFESLDAVQKWFNSPDYQAANQIGQKYAKYNIIAVDGVPPK